MTEGRNSSGKFTKGHPGFKPKGAVSRKKQKQDQLLNQVFGYFENNIEETLKTLKPNQLMKFLINLNQLVTPKLKRIPYVPNPPVEPKELTEPEVEEEADQMETSKEKGEKITFDFVESTDPEPQTPEHT